MDDHDPEEVSERVAELDERVAHLEGVFQEKLEDVRERVVQVKREVDDKVTADHDHEAIIDRLEELESDAELGEEKEDTEGAARLDSLEEKTETLAAAALDVQERLDDLTHLQEIIQGQLGTVDDIEERVERLAGTVQDVQQHLEEGSHHDDPREPVDRLFERANRAGVRRARCSECDERVDIALLRAPSCPACGVTFVDVEAGGLVRSGVLQAGTTPAQEPSDANTDSLKGRGTDGPSSPSRDDQSVDTVDDANRADDAEANRSSPVPVLDDET